MESRILTYGALAIALAAAVPLTATAQSLAPSEGMVQRLGPLSVVTYYTAAEDGLHIVTTVSKTDGDAASVVRFMTVLADGQRATVSVPGKIGQPDLQLVLARIGDRVMVMPPAAKSAAR